MKTIAVQIKNDLYVSYSHNIKILFSGDTVKNSVVGEVGEQANQM